MELKAFIQKAKAKAMPYALPFIAGAGSLAVIDPDMIDTANLSTLISNIGELFPGVVNLVVAVLPLVIIMIIVGLVVSIFGGIGKMVEGLAGIIK
jgi:hypothetical protein